jgi:hypothetical protein
MPVPHTEFANRCMDALLAHNAALTDEQCTALSRAASSGYCRTPLTPWDLDAARALVKRLAVTAAAQ